MTNQIVPATYSDSFSQFPQAVWVRQDGADPITTEDQDDWDTDILGNWPSAQWQLTQTRFVPTGFGIKVLYVGSFSILTIVGGPSPQETCEDPEEPGEPRHSLIFGFEKLGLEQWRQQTDFDAVDVQCVCCD